MLTSDQIKRALARTGEPAGWGAAAHLRRSAPRHGLDTHTPAQRQLLADLESGSGSASPHIVHVHPAKAAAAMRNSMRTRKDQNLTQAEMMWLSRLPTDPTQVSFDDAQRVLALADAVKAPDEKMLLDSIATPIREHHDALVAAADKMNAERPVVPLPTSAVPAMADAIAAEQPNLQPHEAQSRARDAVTQVHQDRVDARAARLAKANEAIAKLGEATATRTSTYR